MLKALHGKKCSAYRREKGTKKALLERRQQKAARRLDNKERKTSNRPAGSGDDPDIAHIKLGPQPPADWQVEEES